MRRSRGGGGGYFYPSRILVIPLNLTVPLDLHSNYICEFIICYKIRIIHPSFPQYFIDVLSLADTLRKKILAYIRFHSFKCVSPEATLRSKSALDQSCPPYAIM